MGRVTDGPMTVSAPPARERATTSAPVSVSPYDRLNERAVLRLGLAMAATFLAAAVGTLLVMPPMAAWAAIHLALAGSATIAIGTFMPHFSVTLAGVRPARSRWRVMGLALLVAGSLLVVVGVPRGAAAVAVAGGLVLLAGVAVTAWVTFAPLRRGIARRHPIVQATYGIALAQLAAGSLLATLMLAGWEPVVDNWLRLKPAHVWLNLFGFVSLTIVATLVYLYPTVLGARIRAHPTLVVGTLGAALGPPLAVLGMALGWELLALGGIGLALAGGIGLSGYVIEVWRRRGSWAFDRDWHRLSSWHLSAGVGWFTIVLGVSFIDAVRFGATPAGWTLGSLAVPLVAGWVVQVLVGSWGHLLPAVGPGSVNAHARQRATLGRWPAGRVAGFNVGVVFLWVGLASERLPFVIGGAVLLLASLSLAIILLGMALRLSIESAAQRRGVDTR
jgi:nitrite reductase (NO-forming)